jgi:hypothetical protein
MFSDLVFYGRKNYFLKSCFSLSPSHLGGVIFFEFGRHTLEPHPPFICGLPCEFPGARSFSDAPRHKTKKASLIFIELQL